MDQLPERIYHLALKAEWDAATAAAQPYRRSTVGRSLDEEGFIHCSFAEQVQGVADRFYSGRDDVVLLIIDSGAVAADLRVEDVGGGESFPHLYGALPLGAVTAVEPVLQAADGRLRAPSLSGEA